MHQSGKLEYEKLGNTAIFPKFTPQHQIDLADNNLTLVIFENIKILK